jgi:arylsulfatase A-like enzyme
LIIHWPGEVDSAQVTAQPAHMVDMLPTFAALAGVEVDMENQDGMNLLPNWLEGQRLEHKPMFWQIIKYDTYQNQGPRPMPHATTAIVDGYWKLLADGTVPTELFDLNNDHRELYNLLENYPDKGQKLLNRLSWVINEPRQSIEDSLITK